MSEIRNRIIKILEESKISFMEDIEAQPDLFGGEDTYYKDGKKAVGFMDVLNFMSEIAPDLDYIGDKQSKDLYWMIYEPATPGINKIDSNKVADIESKLAKKFGENTVTVKLANSQYAPEIKKIYIGFVDVADVEDDGMEEATDLLKKGQRVRIKDTAENFPGEEGIIVNRRYTNLSNTPFYTIKLDSGQPYDVLADNVEPAYLEEGWKDNLKKGIATLGVAGALAGNANAANIHDYYDDRGPHPEQSELYKDTTYVNQYEDKVIDKDGNEWTMDQWADIVAGENPYDDNDTHSDDDLNNQFIVPNNNTHEKKAMNEIKNKIAKYPDLKVVGPTHDENALENSPFKYMNEYYIDTSSEDFEKESEMSDYVDKTLEKIENEYPTFKREHVDFAGRHWFAIETTNNLEKVK